MNPHVSGEHLAAPYGGPLSPKYSLSRVERRSPVIDRYVVARFLETLKVEADDSESDFDNRQQEVSRQDKKRDLCECGAEGARARENSQYRKSTTGNDEKCARRLRRLS